MKPDDLKQRFPGLQGVAQKDLETLPLRLQEVPKNAGSGRTPDKKEDKLERYAKRIADVTTKITRDESEANL